VYQQQQQQQEQEQEQEQEQDAENPFLDPPFSRIKIVEILNFCHHPVPEKVLFFFPGPATFTCGCGSKSCFFVNETVCINDNIDLFCAFNDNFADLRKESGKR
jgi:hypothetical protein